MGTIRDRTDFDEAGQSLAHLAEIVLACLDAIQARSVAEIGAQHGILTRRLLDWAAGAGAGITAVDPTPRAALLELAGQHSQLELVQEVSHEALQRIPVPDTVIVDGDHNYFTVSEELRLIDDRATGAELPLLMLHDVSWPNARRDTYYAPERIPEQHRQPTVRRAALAPGEPGITHAGLRYEWAAEREGGPRNGVLTAVEDFVAEREGLRLAIVPAFFGLGVLWHRDAPWAESLAAVIRPWDRNPILQRLEAHRVANLVARYRHAQELGEIEIMRGEQARNAEQKRLLRAMLASRAFAWGERLSRLRKGGRPTFSREQVKRALGEEES
jgi:hypothetical protein